MMIGTAATSSIRHVPLSDENRKRRSSHSFLAGQHHKYVRLSYKVVQNGVQRVSWLFVKCSLASKAA